MRSTLAAWAVKMLFIVLMLVTPLPLAAQSPPAAVSAFTGCAVVALLAALLESQIRCENLLAALATKLEPARPATTAKREPVGPGDAAPRPAAPIAMPPAKRPATERR